MRNKRVDGDRVAELDETERTEVDRMSWKGEGSMEVSEAETEEERTEARGGAHTGSVRDDSGRGLVPVGEPPWAITLIVAREDDESDDSSRWQGRL